MNELQKISDAQVPAFLQNTEAIGTQALTQYIVPPRLKIIQALSKPPLCDLFNVGDVIVSPNNLLLAPVDKLENGKPGSTGASFFFTPIFFFPEWIEWGEVGSENPILERTQDPASELAKLCANPATWESADGHRRTQHLNFIAAIWGQDELDATPVAMSFSRAGFKDGQQLASLIRMRGNMPIYAHVFEARAHLRENNKGRWYGLQIANPSQVQPYVTDEAAFNSFAKTHKDLADAHASGLVQVDHESDF